MQNWQLQQAKAHLSDLVKEATDQVRFLTTCQIKTTLSLLMTKKLK